MSEYDIKIFNLQAYALFAQKPSIGIVICKKFQLEFYLINN